MICSSCGTGNRPGARFCKHCGAVLPEQPAPWASPPPAPFSGAIEREGTTLADTWDATGTTTAAPGPGKTSLLGGHGLIAFGGLIVLFAFMLPWASCSGVELSGLDIVTQSSQYTEYGGDASWTILVLVPLGALALLAIGGAGLAVNLLGESSPATLARLVSFSPLLAALSGACACCPASVFFLNVQNARSDPESLGLGMLIQIEYGFWLTAFGLTLTVCGIVAALIGTQMARRGAPGPGPPQ